jgi:hypothetical protein
MCAPSPAFGSQEAFDFENPYDHDFHGHNMFTSTDQRHMEDSGGRIKDFSLNGTEEQDQHYVSKQDPDQHYFSLGSAKMDLKIHI